jgi:hypothetical protein
VDSSSLDGCAARPIGGKRSHAELAHFLAGLVNTFVGTPPCFADVWQAQDFKSNDFGSVAMKGVMEDFFGSVAGKEVRGKSEVMRQGCLEVTKKDTGTKA